MKNKEILAKMTLKQKIRVIISNKKNENMDVDDFKLPVFRLSKNPLEVDKDKFVTIFPKSKMLACSWDLDIIKDVYKAIGVETKSFVKNVFFNMSNDLSTQMFSSDPYLNGKMIQAYLNGLHESNMPVSLSSFNSLDKDKRTIYELDNTSAEIEIKEGNPDSIVVDDLENIDHVLKNLKYQGIIFSNATDATDAIKKLNAGSSLIFIEDDIVESIVEAINDYNNTYIALQNKTISKFIFDEKLRNGEIISEDVIIDACDKLISYLMKTSIMQDMPHDEEYVSLSEKRTPYFDEATHASISLFAARNSIVLLKNNGILPLKHVEKTAIIGDFAINPNYQIEGFSNKPTEYKSTYDLIKNYDINAIGFAHGYRSDMIIDMELINASVRLAKQSDVTVLYLYAYDTDRLSDDQLALLSELYKNKVKIVAVLTTNKQIDMSFDDMCEAVLLSNFAGQEVSKAILDILINDYNPSGKIATTFLYDKIDSNIPMYLNADFNNIRVKYPFGYGLSYTQFEYTYLEISENCVTFTVTNKGLYDGYAIPQMYVGFKDSNNPLLRPMLKGFKKVFVRKNESIKVTIPFDEYTFRYYNRDNKCYGIIGGDYNISIRENYKDVRLESIITLSPYLDKVESSSVFEENNDEFLKLDNEILKDKKLFGYRAKIVTILVFLLYIYIFGSITIIINQESSYFYVLVGVLAGIMFISTITAIVLIVLQVKSRKLPARTSNETLTDLVSRVKEFEEVSRVVYKEPVKEEIIKVEKEDLVFENKNIEKDLFDLNSSIKLMDLAKGLNEYLEYKNILVDLHTTKRLLAAFFSSKLIVLNPNDYELCNELIISVMEFFGQKGKLFKETEEVIDLTTFYWKKTSTKFTYSEFSENMLLAMDDRNSFNIIPVVDATSNIMNYFKEILSYASNPNAKHSITLSKNENKEITGNMCFVVVFKDDYSFEDFDNYISLNIQITKNELEKIESKPLVPSMECIKNNLYEAKEKFYIQEENYKKIDELCEFINKYEKYAINNKTIIRLELYTSILLSLELTEEEVIVDLFNDILGITLCNLTKFDDTDSRNDLLDTVGRLFFDEVVKSFKRIFIKNSEED